MIVLVEAAGVAQGNNALLGVQVVELELAELDVEPGAAGQVVQAAPYGFKVKRAGVVRGGQDIKRNILR